MQIEVFCVSNIIFSEFFGCNRPLTFLNAYFKTILLGGLKNKNISVMQVDIPEKSQTFSNFFKTVKISKLGKKSKLEKN